MSVFLKSLIPSKSHPPLSTYNNHQEERRREKNRPWQTEGLNIKLEHFHGPTRQAWARTLSTSEWTQQEANLQVTNLTPSPRLTSQPVKPTLIQVLGIHPCQCLPHCFHASSSRQEWHGVMDVPINCSYFPSFVMKKTGFLGITLLSSLQNLSGSQSIIIGTVPHSVIIQWKVPSINTEEVRDGVTTTQ